MLTDTHCHLDMSTFDADRASVLERAREAGVERILVPALNYETAVNILSLIKSHPQLFAAVGFHPTELDAFNPAAEDRLRSLAKQTKVVAIGEVGLDYYWVTSHRARRLQQTALRIQLDIAGEMHLPVILHMREQNDARQGRCSEDLLIILEDWTVDLQHQSTGGNHNRGVLHSFSGSMETAHSAISLGFSIGVTGPITYPNAASRREIVEMLPLENLLIETDAPFLPPQPFRGRRNEPAFVKCIADRIADIQSRSPSEVYSVTSVNAARLFTWGENS
jgi:TatD DNase family protein